MAEYLAKSEDLTAVADAIRAKGGTDAQLTFPDGMVDAINAIEIGGPTDVTDSVVSVAFSATNASYARAGFYGIIPEDAKIAIFLFQGELSNASHNQCLLAILPKMYLESGMLYIRWRDSSYNLQANSTSEYDLVVNAGDTYRMVVIR